MKSLILIGAGDFGLEVWSWVRNSKGFNEHYTFKGFLDENLEVFKEKSFHDNQILSRPSEYFIQPEDVFVCTIGNPLTKKKVVNEMIGKGARFVNLIHKSVIEFENITYGEGVIISPNCVISNNVKIGSHVSINLFCSIGHDVEIGKFSVLNSHCDVTGRVLIKDEVMIGSRVTIIPKVSIIEGAVLGAGAVVMRSIKERGTYIGNPAKRLI